MTTATERYDATDARHYLDMHRGCHAVVLGNGASRLALDLSVFGGRRMPARTARELIAYFRGSVQTIDIGCNAIVRDHAPVYAMAVDRKAIDEWHDVAPTRPFGATTVYLNGGDRHGVTDIAGVPVVHFRPDTRPVGLAGIAAASWAVWIGADVVTFAGFDCDLTNVYLGTPGYRSVGVEHKRQGERMMERMVATQKAARVARAMMPITQAELTGDVVNDPRPLPTFLQLPPHTFEWATPIEVPERWKL